MKSRFAVAVSIVSLSAICLAGAGPARAQGEAPRSHGMMMKPDELKWGPLPGAPAGAMLAILSGDPNSPDSKYVMRIKTPDGYKIPPHWHPKPEHITVISGTLFLGTGENWDPVLLKELPAGSYAEMPKKMRHFGTCRGETIVQIHGNGPFVIKYVHPEDDPSRKTSDSAAGGGPQTPPPRSAH